MTTESALQTAAPIARPLPPGHEDYAGEIMVANGRPPRWMARVPSLFILWALAYYGWVFLDEGRLDPVNLVFAGLFVIWLVYTPIAQKRGWFFIPM